MADGERTGGDGGSGPLGQLRQVAGRNPVTEKLYDVGEDYLRSKAENVVSSAARKLGSTTQKLNDMAEGGGKAGMAVKGAENLAEGKSPASAAASAVGGGLKDKVKGLFGKGGGKGGSSSGGKVINIVEDIDVGVPVREAYDQWTQFQEFSGFSKGVAAADKGDDVTSTWKFKIFWSNRSMKATISEQIPDERIVWSSDGAKGSIKGVVTFHALGENLTKILLVIEYYPAGFFEKTGNIWRAQGRRARLDLKHYRRFIMMQGEASDGWRGEIRDGEVVRTHEEAMDAEERDAEERDEDYDADYDEGYDADSYEDEPDEEEEDFTDDAADEDEDEDEDLGQDSDDYDEEDGDEPEDVDEDDSDEYEDEPDDEPDEPELDEDVEDEPEPEEEPRPRPRRRRQRAGAGR